ncbi:phage tail tape measure protein [Fictibacillus norfolkensis]|uniref:Phage tail tape measure protein n=1 Tax=Fictibacillus norfolkensis TaxID=2762233 RepID=A0ABR8SPH0_9BACL|nr:phage tail tape measure protein [Fictibacillus norfolkensis]MBD7965393.1 phage tail tape measure protein [Fictibacillus norfolkensis]
MSIDTREWSIKQAQIKRDMAGMSRAAVDTKKSMTGIQIGALAMGSAVVAGLGASVAVAANFEQSIAKVKAVTNASEEEFQSLTKTAEELGRTTQFSASEASDAMYNLATAGFDTNQIIDSMPGVLNLAAAAQVNMATAAEITGSVLSGFGLEAAEAARVVDVLAQTANQSNSSIPDLGEAMKYVAPVAKTLGISLEEKASSIGLLSNAGIKGSEAGTALRAAMLALANPVGAGAKAIERLGIEVTTADGKMKPLPELIGHIASKMDGMTDAQKTSTAAQLVGTEAASGLLVLLENGQSTIQDFTKELENSGGVAERVAKVQMDTLMGSFKEFQSAAEGLGIAVGNEMLPTFRQLTEFGTDVLGVLNEMDPALLSSGLRATGAAAGVALLATTAVKLGMSLRALSLALGPAGYIILGLSALAGIAVAASDAHERHTEVSLENYNAMKQNNDALNESITAFETLSAKNRLSSDEMQRFLDITTELNQTADPAAITRLKDEQAKLSEKSGLSAQEMQNLVKANDDIIKKVPDSNKVLTDQGNILLKNADAAKKLSDEQLNGMRTELNEQKIKAEAKLNDLMSDRESALNRMNRAIERQKELVETRKTQEVFLAEQETILADMKANKNLYAQKEIDLQQTIVLNAKDDLQLSKERIAKEQGKIEKQRESLAESDKEIKKLDTINQKLVNIELQQVGINNKKGNGIRLVDNEIAKLMEQKRKLDESTSAKDKNNSEYREAIATIDREIGKLNAAKDAVNRITGAQSGVNSRVADGIALAQRLNDVLSKSINKTVNITEIKRLITQSERAARSIGVDTSRHQGGPLPKFHSGGSPALSLPPSHHEIDVRLLRNEMVLTEAQQSSLFRMLDVPNVRSENNGLSAEDITRIINAASNAKQPVEIPLFIDSYEVARATWPAVDQFQATQASNDYRNKGNKF